MVLIGDIHGTFRTVSDEIKNGSEKHIIQVGDFGLGFNNEQRDMLNMTQLDNLLSAHFKTLYVVRGNHDDPKYWDGRWEKKWANIDFVPDYGVRVIEGKYVLFIGGAVSIDRRQRAIGVDHWHGVEFDYDEDKMINILDENNIDIVVTHTSPDFCFPRGFNDLVHRFAALDPELLADLNTERILVGRIYDLIKAKCTPEAWVYGHFHQDVTEEIDGTKFILLGIGTKVNL